MAAYPLDQCGLFAVRSKAKLAGRLGRSVNFLRARASNPALYRVWEEPKRSGGFRLIEAPREDLKAIQRRIADLLQRVLPPDYLYSPVKGRSYVENAMSHRDAVEIRLLDISDYFGNCSASAVFQFFNRECAAHLTSLGF